MGFSHSWRDLGGSLGIFFAKVEFGCLLAAMIGRFEFSQDGKRKVIVKAGVT